MAVLDHINLNGTEYDIHDAGAYRKPNGGIPKSDLADGVKESLNRADNAAPQSTTYTKSETDTKLSQKANSSSVYTKSETDERLAVKANASDVNSAIGNINAKIPSEASSANQLADKQFVNSSIATATATFRGTYNLVSDLAQQADASHAQIEAALGRTISGADNNDYAFVQVPTSTSTPTQIAKVERYKYNGTAWSFEYELNNSGFTASQWAAINSGITSSLVTKLSQLPTNAQLTTLLLGKQDVIQDLETIRSGAEKGATSVQPSDIVDSRGVFDLSAHNAVNGQLATYDNLSAALVALNALDSQYKYGGMSFKFVLTGDNKYVRFDLMANAFTTDVTKWQGVDEKPIVGSRNLAESGGTLQSLESLELDVTGLVTTDWLTTSSIVPYYRTDGSSVNNANRQRTGLIKVSQGDVFVYNLTNSTTLFMISAFDSSKELLTANSVAGSSDGGGKYIVPNGVSYLQFCVNGTTGFYVRKINSKYYSIYPSIDMEKVVASNSILGAIEKGVGVLTPYTDSTIPFYKHDGTINYSDARRKTVAIPVRKGDIFDYSIATYGNTYCIAALDDCKNLIAANSVQGVGGNTPLKGSYTVPEGVFFLIFEGDITGDFSVIRRGSFKQELESNVIELNKSILRNNVNFGTLVPVGFQQEFPCSLTSDGKFDTTNDRHIVIPVVAGQIVNIKRGIYNSAIAFVKTYNIPSAGDTVDYATGESRKVISGTSLRVYTVPEDARYLIVVTLQSNDNSVPSILTVDGYDIIGGVIPNVVQKVEKNWGYFKSSTSVYAECFDELYIPQEALDGVDHVELRNAYGSIFLQANSQSEQVVWKARLYGIFEDDKIYAVPCITAGGNLLAGDIAAYIIFKDAATFNSNSQSAYTIENNINLDYTLVRYNPRIASIFNVEITLPDTVYAVVGDNLQIYHKSVVKANDYKDYSIVVVCDYGKNYPRYFEFTPVQSQIGTKKLSYRVYDNSNVLIAKKDVQLVIKAQPSSPASAINVLTLGASIYTDGVLVSELNRRLTSNTGDGTPYYPTGLNLSNINFVGRKEVNGIHQEASGGWGWRIFDTNDFKAIRFQVTGVQQLYLGDTYSINGVSSSSTYYLTIAEINVTEGTGNILCEVNGGYVYPEGAIPATGSLNKITGNGDATIAYSSYVQEPGNPLWNETSGRIDFQYYSQQYCGGVDIDVLMTNMGINDFRFMTDVDSKLESYVKPLIRQYHSDYPNGKVVLGTIQLPDARGGVGANSGASEVSNFYNISNVYWYYNEKIQEMANDVEFSSYVIIADCCAEFDCENAYPYREANVDNRCSVTEKLGTNMSHPTQEVKKLNSDTFYRCICSKILQ